MKLLMRLGRCRPTLVAVAAASGLGMAPGVAHAGFFEQLFGGVPGPAPVVAPAPSPSYDQAQPSRQPVFREIRRQRKKLAIREHKDVGEHKDVREHKEKTPVLQKTTDLMHDKTLRSGDAIMMKDGLRIYAGREGSKHVADQFRPLNDIRHLSAKERGELVAMDMSHAEPLLSYKQAGLREGRSIVEAPPITSGYKITDARGKSIRYVGP